MWLIGIFFLGEFAPFALLGPREQSELEEWNGNTYDSVANGQPICPRIGCFAIWLDSHGDGNNYLSVGTNRC